jgi:hypothetical protein
LNPDRLILRDVVEGSDVWWRLAFARAMLSSHGTVPVADIGEIDGAFIAVVAIEFDAFLISRTSSAIIWFRCIDANSTRASLQLSWSPIAAADVDPKICNAWGRDWW